MEKKKVTWKELPTFNKVAVIVFFVGIVGLIAALSIKDDRPKEMPSKETAYLNAQRFVEKNLKSPTSADFPFSDFVVQINPSDSTYLVSSYVDAVNSFNAKIRSNWAVKMKLLPDDNWKLLDIDIK